MGLATGRALSGSLGNIITSLAQFLRGWGHSSLHQHHLCRVSLTIMWTQQGRAIPWAERAPKAFFRGRDSNQARLDLVQRHHRDTENYDVGLTNYFFFPHKEELYGPVASYVGMSSFFKVSVTVVTKRSLPILFVLFIFEVRGGEK